MKDMVKLQKVQAYKYTTKSGKTKSHYKYLVSIPHDIIRELGWNGGDELKLLNVSGILQLKSMKN